MLLIREEAEKVSTEHVHIVSFLNLERASLLGGGVAGETRACLRTVITTSAEVNNFKECTAALSKPCQFEEFKASILINVLQNCLEALEATKNLCKPCLNK